MRRRRTIATLLAIAASTLFACGASQSADTSGAAKEAETETFQDRPQKPIDGDAPEAETKASIDEMRTRVERISLVLDEAEAGMSEMSDEERIPYAEKLQILRERRMDVVKSLDQIEAEEAGPEPERKVFPIDVQKELEQLDADAEEFRTSVDPDS